MDSATQTGGNVSDAATQTDETVHEIPGAADIRPEHDWNSGRCGMLNSSHLTQTDDLEASVYSGSQTDTLGMIDDPNDPSYEPTDSQTSTLLTSQSSQSLMSAVDDRKFVVFECQLDKLLGLLVCPTCQCLCCMDDIDKKCNEGTLLRVTAHCINGHVIVKWQSQPLIGRMPAGNLLIGAATLFTGQTYGHMQNIAELLNLKFMSHTPFYTMQHTNFIPVIMAAWKKHQQSVFDELRIANKPLRLCGDGRMDSPGFSAKYCTYSLMDMNTDKVVAFAVLDVTEANGSSTNMEVLAFERCLQELLDNGFTVDVIATDRHVQVRSLMKRKYPMINHQFDVWHLVKSVRKKLHSVSHKKLNSDLSPWSQSICNHLWWCAANCGGDADLLEESWTSVVHHIANIHDFAGDIYTKCAHPPLTDDEQRRKKWLTPCSPAHNALKEIVFSKALLKDVRQLNQFCHTGNLEVYHSLMTKYCPKRQEFDTVQMLARTTLAVLDHNHNTGRKQKTTADGDLRYKLVFTKASAKWVAKPIYENKTYEHVWHLMNGVVEQQERHLLAPVESSHLQNIAPVPASPKQEMISKHLSRFTQD